MDQLNYLMSQNEGLVWLSKKISDSFPASPKSSGPYTGKALMLNVADSLKVHELLETGVGSFVEFNMSNQHSACKGYLRIFVE